jgi:hypothetical protein
VARASIWRSIAVALAVFAGAALACAIGLGIWLVRGHTSAAFVDASAAQAQFDAVHAQLAASEPLFEVRTAAGSRTPVIHRNLSAPLRPIAALHVLSYDPRIRKLARADIPGWVLDVVSVRGTIRIANLEMFDDRRDRVTLADLERHGPGLVAEIAGPPHIVIWTE